MAQTGARSKRSVKQADQNSEIPANCGLYAETGARFVTQTQQPKASRSSEDRLQVRIGDEKMRRSFQGSVILILTLVAGLAVTSSVQAEPQRKGTSTLTGLVLGPDDKPVPHAAVSYQSSGGNAPHAVHTDVHGRFRITKLTADNYDVRASGRGVFSEWEKNVTLHRGQTREITLRLVYAKKIPKSYVGKKPQ